MNTLDAVLHDALAQSERSHSGLAAPSVRSTIARKRVVRRAAVSSAATLGAVSIGAGAYAVSTGFAPVVAPAGASSSSTTPASSPTPATRTANGTDPMISQNAPEDPNSLSSRRATFCENLPLNVAWSAAQGMVDPSWGITYSQPGQAPMFGCFVTDNVPADGQRSLEISFTFADSTGAVLANEKCIDDAGTMTFETIMPAKSSDRGTRTGIACLDGAVVTVEENVAAEMGFALTDAQIQVSAEASVAMANQARSLTP